MDRKKYMKELEYLLQDISEEDRKDALSFYENYFDEAGEENESHVIAELGEPSRIAAIIKDGLKGSFDEHIHVGNSGFSEDTYQRSYEVIDAKEKIKDTSRKSHSNIKDRWTELDSRDKTLLIIIGLFALIPLSFPFFGVFGGLFGVSFSIFMIIMFCVFGFWIVTFFLYIAAFILMIIGIVNLFIMPGAGLIYIGVSFLLSAVGTIFSKIATWFFKDFIVGIINAISDGFAKMFHKGAKS